jgi:hypothetical protein
MPPRASGITVSQIDNTLYDAFGQRQVSTIYVARNQYHVIMEVAPAYLQNPQTLRDVYVSTSGGSASGSQTTNAVAGRSCRRPGRVAQFGRGQRGAQSRDQLDRRHRQGRILDRDGGQHQPGDDDSAVERRPVRTGPDLADRQPSGGSGRQHHLVQSRARRLAGHRRYDDRGDHEPDRGSRTIRGSFQGAAKIFQESLASEPYLVLAAFATIYISLGMLYESYVHPLTILSTLPSAGVGAVLALMLFHTQFDIIAMIGVILLIGIVKKNAIMMIDFALDAERKRGLSPADAILRSLPAALPAHHDDHHGVAARRGAADRRHGRRQRVPPAARHHHHRRTGAEPDPDPLHHARRLSVSRSLPALEQAVDGCRRATCGFYPCAFCCTGGCRVRQAPGFPCALCFSGAEIPAELGRIAPRGIAGTDPQCDGGSR